MTETTVISVVIADDHELLRRGLADLISTHSQLSLVGEAQTLTEAVALCQQARPDVVLLDLLAAGADGIETIREIRRGCPDTRIIALTQCTDEATIVAAVQAGVTSYLLKNTSAEALIQAIMDAHAGRSTLAREATQALVNGSQRENDTCFQLTRRERDVLVLLTQGRKNVEIAEALTVSRSTVKKHVSSILTKLDASSRTEAVAVAMQHNLVQL